MATTGLKKIDGNRTRYSTTKLSGLSYPPASLNKNI
jgi:hypothetical protein